MATGDTTTFSDRQRRHFSRILHEKWCCVEPSHYVCVPTDDGQHFQLSDKDVELWIDALCAGTATTAQPPEQTFEKICGGAVWNRKNGKMEVKAVSIAPFRRRDSVHTAVHLPTVDDTGQEPLSVWSKYSSTIGSSSRSSGTPGPGYLSGRAMKWLGEKSLDVIQDIIIRNRANSHISCLKKWRKREEPKLDQEERELVSKMLDDALVMSRPYYSNGINALAYDIGTELQEWLHCFSDLPATPETWKLVIQVLTCLIPLLLTKIARSDPLAADLAWELIDALTLVPLELNDEQAPAGTHITHLDTAGIAIRIVAHELAYSRCGAQHPWLGVHFLRIVELTLRVRSLSQSEVAAIWELCLRRRNTRHRKNLMSEVTRPWEVALFAICAVQNAKFKSAVLDPDGLPNLLHGLDVMLDKGSNIDWENVSLTLRSLAFLSVQKWVVDNVDPAIITSLLGVFRTPIPERWFCIRFWAADTLRNIVAHRPPLSRDLIEQNAVVCLSTLFNSEPVSPSAGNKSPTSPSHAAHTHERTSSSTSSDPPSAKVSSSHSKIRTKYQKRMFEDYKREAAKRAEELTTYIQQWTTWTPQALSLVMISGWDELKDVTMDS